MRAPLPRANRSARPASQLSVAADIASEAVEETPETALEEPRAVIAARERPRSRPRGGTLATTAATEYLYVAQDLRRILVVAVVLFALMFALWLLIVVARVIPV